MITEARQVSVLSWFMIATVCIMVIYNVIVIVYDSVSTIRLLYVRYRHRLQSPNNSKKKLKSFLSSGF